MRDPTAEVRFNQIQDEVKTPGRPDEQKVVRVKVKIPDPRSSPVKILDRDHRIRLIPDMADAAPQ